MLLLAIHPKKKNILPGVCSRLYGLRVGPGCEKANSVVTVFPFFYYFFLILFNCGGQWGNGISRQKGSMGANGDDKIPRSLSFSLCIFFGRAMGAHKENIYIYIIYIQKTITIAPASRSICTTGAFSLGKALAGSREPQREGQSLVKIISFTFLYFFHYIFFFSLSLSLFSCWFLVSV